MGETDCVRVMEGTKPRFIAFWRFSGFLRTPQKTNYFKNSLLQNRLPQLTLQKPIGKIFFKRIFSYQNKSQPRSVPNSDQLSHVLLTC